MKRAAILFGAMVLVWPLLAVAGAFLSDSVKIGVMNDQNGLYVDLQGSGSVAAIRMAAEDFGRRIQVWERPLRFKFGSGPHRVTSGLRRRRGK